MKTETKNEIKDCLFMAGMHSMMIIFFAVALSVNAKAETVKNNSLQACKTMSIQPLKNGLVVADMVDSYSIADYKKAIIQLENKEFTTYNNAGNCTVRYEI